MKPAKTAATPKKPIQYFVCYARKDNAHKTKLVESLGLHLNLSKSLEFKRWQDADILVGEDWHEAIAEAAKAADTGLLLLSPAFFASSTIREEELPPLLEKNLGVLPVLLKPLDFSKMDLGVFNDLDVFTLNGKAFSQMRGSAQQDEFVMGLFRAITRKLA
jgi:TIR domain